MRIESTVIGMVCSECSEEERSWAVNVLAGEFCFALDRLHNGPVMMVNVKSLTFRHRASSILDRRFATLQRTLFVYLINKYISLSDMYLTVHH